MLYYTPILFTSVIVHAHLVQHTYFVGLFSLLTYSSVMYHLMYQMNHPHRRIVKKIDTCLAFQSVLVPLYLNYLYYNDTYNYLANLYVPLMYVWNTLYNHGNDFVHGTLHIVGTIGIHRFLYLYGLDKNLIRIFG